MKYEIIFHSGNYKCVDGIAYSYDQALEIKNELTDQMFNSGERDFYYEIVEKEDEQ
jgi:hypothetical protein